MSSSNKNSAYPDLDDFPGLDMKKTKSEVPHQPNKLNAN